MLPPLVYLPTVQHEKEIEEEEGVWFIDNGPRHSMSVVRHILRAGTRPVVPLTRNTTGLLIWQWSSPQETSMGHSYSRLNNLVSVSHLVSQLSLDFKVTLTRKNICAASEWIAPDVSVMHMTGWEKISLLQSNSKLLDLGRICWCNVVIYESTRSKKYDLPILIFDWLVSLASN
jgi:hypothetical protein